MLSAVCKNRLQFLPVFLRRHSLKYEERKRKNFGYLNHIYYNNSTKTEKQELEAELHDR